MLLYQGSWVGSNPTGRFDFSVWESLGIRVPWEHEIVGSNPTTLTDVMRWVLCWYGKATVNRPDAGSIPATAAGWKSPSWKQGPAADRQGGERLGPRWLNTA